MDALFAWIEAGDLAGATETHLADALRCRNYVNDSSPARTGLNIGVQHDAMSWIFSAT
jgi:hypothetical protein